MRIHLYILPALVVTLSCAHRHTAAVQASHPTAPQPAFERQIRNALDAGEGDYNIRLLRAKLAAEPDNLQLRLDLAAAYRHSGFPDIALEHYRLAAERFPASAPAALELAKALRAADQREQAARVLDQFLAANLSQRSPELHSWQGILRDSLGRWAEGEKAHRDAIALAPASDYLHNNLGFNLLKQNRNGEAAAEFRKALELNPASVLARNNLALVSGPGGALEEWTRLYDPATAHSNMAALLIEQGKYPDARKELDIALGYNQAHAAALNNLKLVSELDGAPAIIHAQPVETRWTRFLSTLRSLFVGPLPPEPKPAGQPMASLNGRGL